ncbi:MAG: hypothetical protein RL490_568 [Pseudomonadota bacterium]|jgi:hypothetical protein
MKSSGHEDLTISALLVSPAFALQHYYPSPWTSFILLLAVAALIWAYVRLGLTRM